VYVNVWPGAGTGALRLKQSSRTGVEAMYPERSHAVVCRFAAELAVGRRPYAPARSINYDSINKLRLILQRRCQCLRNRLESIIISIDELNENNVLCHPFEGDFHE